MVGCACDACARLAAALAVVMCGDDAFVIARFATFILATCGGAICNQRLVSSKHTEHAGNLHDELVPHLCASLVLRQREHLVPGRNISQTSHSKREPIMANGLRTEAPTPVALVHAAQRSQVPGTSS